MAHEAYVQLSCPECGKAWQQTPSDLPEPEADFECPKCGTTRRTSEFMRTDRDLENLKRLK